MADKTETTETETTETETEETSNQNATGEQDTTETQGENQDEQQETENSDIDYDKEFEQALKRFEDAEKNREGYAKRKAQSGQSASQDDIEAIVQSAIAKAIPNLQASLEEDQTENILDQLSSSDAEKKLIRFHLENSVGNNGTLRERIENAKLIANKKTILNTQKEMALALQNRQGISSTGQGHSSSGQTVADNFFSKEQLQELRARGFDDKKIQRLKENMRK